MSAPRLTYAFTFAVGVAPGGILSVTATLFKNGVATAMTATITGSATSATYSGSLSFAAGDQVSVKLTSADAGTAARPVVQFSQL